MSFISKLLRKETAELPEIGQSQPEAPGAPNAGDAAARGAAQPLDAGAGQAAGMRAEASSHAENAARETPAAATAMAGAWWDETPSQPPAVAASAMPAGADGQTQPATAKGTQPLDPERDRQPNEPDRGAPITGGQPSVEQEEDGGTRQLTSADKPRLAALRSRRGLAAAALRDIGRVRSVNQDSIFSMITTLPRESGDVSIGLFVVADGMGGHHGGEVASRLAISTVAHHVLAELVVPALADGATEALQPLIIAAVQEANRAIWEHAQTVGSDMGTTCTVALLLGRALYLGHVGDSRAYLGTPTGLKQISNDHSTVGRLIQVGQLDRSEAREHPLRSQLYRTVGQQPDVLVDFTYQQIGDATHLLLASDGLWSMLDDEVMFDVLEHTSWPHDACNELIARANLAGGEDNISAIVVSIPEPT